MRTLDVRSFAHPFVGTILGAWLGYHAAALAEPPAPATVQAPAASLEELLAPITQDKLFTTADIGIQVVNVRTGEEVFARNADVPLIPASTMKVVTAAVALENLGPSYRFTTDFLVDEDAKVGGDGVLHGNLYVQGHGDPTLVVETMWKITRDLKLQGLKKIDGNVVYDESFFGADYALPGWNKEEDLERGPVYFSTIGALSLNYNTAAVVVGPGEGVGKAARVELETPAPKYVKITNNVVTTAAGSRRSVKIDRSLTDDDPPMLEFKLTGTVPADGDTDHYYRTVIDPTANFMSAFEEMLALQGITVAGKHVRGTAPEENDVYYRHRSESLEAILMEMNKQSNNFYAETVLRTVGAEVYGLPGTTEKGLQAVQAYFGTIGVDPKEYKVVNGSGLSRDARLRASTLTALMLDMAYDKKVGHEFATSLAIAGQDGTLSRRLTDEKGELRGKTGTIDGVHCLTGYLNGGDGETYAFAFLVNDVAATSSAKRVQDKLARKVIGMNAPAAAVVENTPDDADENAGEN